MMGIEVWGPTHKSAENSKNFKDKSRCADIDLRIKADVWGPIHEQLSSCMEKLYWRDPLNGFVW
jgi:hypothetical protein